MNWYFKRLQNLLMAVFLLLSGSVIAEPYLAVKTGLKCQSCHVNPIGGGMRNNFGNIYGHSQLPVDTSDFTSSDMGKINDFLGLRRFPGSYIENSTC